MLGYVVSNKDELKVREAELYRAYYCGVCKAISSRYGQLPRMILSYDSAFLAILIDSLNAEKEVLKRKVCIANPIKKKAVAFSRGIDFSADIMLCLAWFKILDDIKDENSKVSKSLKILYKKSFDRIKLKHENLVLDIEMHINKLSMLEESGTSSIDEVADCFAMIMKSIFEYGYEYTFDNDLNNFDMKAMGQLGYHMGRWVYLIDALDDLEENIENGGYNPILKRFNYQGENFREFKDFLKGQMEQTLTLSLDMATKALDLIDIKKNRSILENVLFVGMLGKTKEVSNK